MTAAETPPDPALHGDEHGAWDEGVEDRLRRRILAAIHRGSLSAGDRLMSIRAVARDLSVDHRAVARAYRRLESEGLVEVRARSGVYLAPQEWLGRVADGKPILSETSEWLARVLSEAWHRGLSPRDLALTLTRAAPPSGVRTACLESVRDPLHALSAEVEAVTGVSCERVAVPAEQSAVTPKLPEDLLRSPPDIVLTTAYHVTARRAAEDAGIPLVLLRVNREWSRTLRRWAMEPGLIVVVDDPSAADRFRLLLGPAVPVDFLEIARLESVGDPPPGRAVYGTALARPQLPRPWAERLTVPDVPLLDPRTVRELFDVLLRIALRG